MKKALGILLALVLVFAMAVPAFAVTPGEIDGPGSLPPWADWPPVFIPFIQFFSWLLSPLSFLVSHFI